MCRDNAVPHSTNLLAGAHASVNGADEVGVQQLEQAVASIKKLSEDIKSMTETFKVSGN